MKGILNWFKSLFKKEVVQEPEHIPNPEDVPEEVKKLVEDFKQSFEEEKKTSTKPLRSTKGNNTPIQKVNRHGEYGFALRRANKQNRKPGRITPSYPPASFV